MAQYGRLEYWNRRYSLDDEPFEWYQQYVDIKKFFAPQFLSFRPDAFPKKNELRVLVVGCGNSRLSEDMKKDGFESVVSVDFSSVVIEKMKRKYPQSTYAVVDVTKPLPYADGSFEIVVCKGTLDAVLCSQGSHQNVKMMFAEISRVLGDQGAMITVSYGTPENRMVYFEGDELGWVFDVHTVPKQRARGNRDETGVHYVYICRKGSRPPEIEANNDILERDEKSTSEETTEESKTSEKLEKEETMTSASTSAETREDSKSSAESP